MKRNENKTVNLNLICRIWKRLVTHGFSLIFSLIHSFIFFWINLLIIKVGSGFCSLRAAMCFHFECNNERMNEHGDKRDNDFFFQQKKINTHTHSFPKVETDWFSRKTKLHLWVWYTYTRTHGHTRLLAKKLMDA